MVDPISLLLEIFAGFYFYAFITHAMIGWRSQPRNKTQLSFAVASLLIGLYSVISIFQNEAIVAGSADGIATFNRWNLFVLYLFHMSLLWFIVFYTDAKNRLLPLLLSLLFIGIAFFNILAPFPGNWVLSSIEVVGSSRVVSDEVGLAVTFRPWYQAWGVLWVLIFTSYTGYFVRQQDRRGKRSDAIALAIAFSIYILGQCWDLFLVDNGLVPIFHLGPFGVLVMVLVMSLRLSSQTIQSERALRQLNLELEDRVGKRTAALSAANEALIKANEVADISRRTAEAANRAKSVFLANMSHELRTPLNAILGFTQTMQHDRDFPPKQRGNLDMIAESGQHLLDLINEVLEMSKIEAGRITLNVGDFDLYYTLERLKSSLGMHAGSKGLDLEFTQKDDVPRYIRTDEGKLRQVLLNVLGNAIKFTEVGSVRLSVSYESVESSRGILKFSVEDTGIGIAPDEIDLVFEPFSQTESGQKSGKGTGLGLPISQQFVNLMGGEISVESQFGEGSTFSFDIAVEVVEPIKPVPKESARFVAGLAPGQPAYRVLVVDDNRENRVLLEQMLSKVGFEVRTVNDGQAAIDSFQSWRPDLIWMDIRMPGMDGIQVTQQIKDSDGPGTIIIAVTASVFEEDRVGVLEAGCDDFVRKPFTEQEIFNMMAKHLGVTYIYDELEAQSKPRKALSAEDLAVLPRAWVEKLNQAANRGRVQPLRDLIAQIETEYPWIAESLLQLIDEYQFKQIVDLTEPKINDG